jgi:mono/diheme cytochrome c family protein
LDGAPGGGRRSVRWLAGAGAAAGLIAVAVIAAVVLAERDGAPTPSSALPAPRFDPLPMTSPGGPPELSKIAPRLRFVPMAIQAYGALPALDRDAHFHLGLIHRVAGNRANLAAQIAALRQGAPNHLLALLLEHDSAEQAGDSAAVSRLLAAFAAAYDAEIAMARPEYEAHRGTIERFRAAALRAASSTAELTGDAREGADLFAKDCAACHGPGAAGSDKGPPLVDRIYEPSHHDDASFRRTVRQGVRAHHWPFGDMQPVPGVSDRNVERIIAYVRALQRAAGIR